jgi:hypothetical protein
MRQSTIAIEKTRPAIESPFERDFEKLDLNNSVEPKSIYVYGIFSDLDSSCGNNSKKELCFSNSNITSPLDGSKIDENNIHFLFREKPGGNNYTVVLKNSYYEDPLKISKKDLLAGLKMYFEKGEGSIKNFILVLSGHGE